jgi:exosortase family protein XrtM
MSTSLPHAAASGVHWSNAHGTYVDAGDKPLPGSGRGLHFVGRAVLFTLIFAALMLGWNALRGGSVERLVVHDATVRPAAWLANRLTPGLQARAVEASIRAPGGGLNILNGCEGVDALFLLVAAFLVVPLPVRARALGLLSGVALVHVCNQARILLLFYAYRHDPALFAFLHGTVTPIVMVLVIAAYFHVWLHRHAPRTAAAA